MERTKPNQPRSDLAQYCVGHEARHRQHQSLRLLSSEGQIAMRKQLLIILVFLLTLGIILGCQKNSKIIEFCMANGYSGILRLRANSANGLELKETNGIITLMFPASGLLDIKGALPTLDWHKPMARFADGTIIPISERPAKVSNNTIALRGLGVKYKNTESWFLVGTADQMQEAMNKFYGFDVPKR